MQDLSIELKQALQSNYHHLIPLDDALISFFNDPSNINKHSHTITAVVLFNWALLHLDVVPDDRNREQHVLVGDFLLSQFYTYIAREDTSELLSEMMTISKRIHTEKSRILHENTPLSRDGYMRLLYQPFFYLVENDYVSERLIDILIDVLDRDKKNEYINE